MPLDITDNGVFNGPLSILLFPRNFRSIIGPGIKRQTTPPPYDTHPIAASQRALEYWFGLDIYLER